MLSSQDTLNTWFGKEWAYKHNLKFLSMLSEFFLSIQYFNRIRQLRLFSCDCLLATALAFIRPLDLTILYTLVWP